MSFRAAVLIIAHHQPEVFAALVDSLHHPSIDIYVHIDAKADLASFEAVVPEGGRVSYLRERSSVNWGGLSIVRVILRLIERARSSGNKYQRYALLSGSDLLIAPIDEVLTAWQSSTEFIRVDWRLTGPGARRTHQVDRRHFPDDRLPLRARLSGRIPRKVDPTVELYQGSAWWALTAGAVDQVTGFIAEHPRWLDFHRHTLCSDEIVFHSILKAAPHASRIVQDVEQCADVDAFIADPVHALHHIDWSDRTALSPRVFGIDDEPTLRTSPALFARKVDETSTALIDAFAVNPDSPR
ncbi:beta-1,6-N-acetylglucosaminyltransferase [Rhodococcus sp. 24CO]|uniref:beta-1,6-N-acetylglucosaminyltransferase n=1 Tax=Rhodococcus sp. 24CO TaxID=3117460 RepID=UPI003D32588C